MIIGYPSNVFLDTALKGIFIEKLKSFGVLFVENDMRYVLVKRTVPVATTIVVRALLSIPI